ncbi:hypothetical protein RugamoR64_39600 [Duganella rhizosphaerae]|uniref:hypothetical protein n=1 Tax=Duganella rhizosphaerae TaxID=2885763 RepID=UPI0030E8D787
MTTLDAKTFAQITETVRGAVHRLYTTSPPKDAAHVAQHHAMALGMIIVWADLSFDMSGDRAARVQVQGELESEVENFDIQARQRLGLPH